MDLPIERQFDRIVLLEDLVAEGPETKKLSKWPFYLPEGHSQIVH